MLQLNQLQQLAARRPNEIAELQAFFRNASLPLDTMDSLPTLASRIQQERSFRRDLVSHLWIISHNDVPLMPMPEVLGILTVAAAGVHHAANASEADAHALLRFLMDVRRSFENATSASPVIPIRSTSIATPIPKAEPPAPAVIPVFPNRRDPVGSDQHNDLDIDEETHADRRPLIGLIVAACLVIGLSLLLWLHRPAAPQNAAAIMPSTQSPMPIMTSEQPVDAPAMAPATATAKPQNAVAIQRASAMPTSRSLTVTHRSTLPTVTETPSVASAAARSQSFTRNSARAATPSAQPIPSSTSRRKPNTHVASSPIAPKAGGVPFVPKIQPIDLGTDADTSLPSTSTTRATVRPVSLGIMAANVTYSPAPAYPQAASAAHVQGEVKVEAQVDTDGNVTSARVISGPPLLREAAVSAVEHWRYRPYMAEGKPITMSAVIVMDFQLP